jgi:D-glycero-alpha-D-manno-heptose-7-phosphate kinase
MVITRTPLRISIGGGGTDLPSFYKKYGSFFISAAINYYVYLAAKRSSTSIIRLVYSKIEEVDEVNKINHPIIKACFKYLNINTKLGLEIVSIGDLPTSTGMGSSGSFTVGLINTLRHLERKSVSARVLAQEACRINIEILREPSGKQDEYIAAHGGINCFEVNSQGEVRVYPMDITRKTANELQNNLLLFYTKIKKSSNESLIRQREAVDNNDRKVIANLQKIQEIAYKIKQSLESGNVTRFGKLLDEHWRVKRKRSAVSNTQIDKWYDLAIKNGALGGKLMGAGGGGFFLFYCEDKKKKLINTFKKEGLEEVRFNFDLEGSKLLVNI